MCTIHFSQTSPKRSVILTPPLLRRERISSVLLLSPDTHPLLPPLSFPTSLHFFCPVLLSSPLTFTSFYQCPPFSFPPLDCLFLSEMFLSLSLSHYFLFAYLPCVLSLLHCLFLSVSISPSLSWRWPWRFSLRCVFRRKALSSLPPLCFPHTAQSACLGYRNAPTHVSAFKNAGIQWKYDSLHLNMIMPYQTWTFIFPLFYNKNSWWKSHKLSCNSSCNSFL